MGTDLCIAPAKNKYRQDGEDSVVLGEKTEMAEYLYKTLMLQTPSKIDLVPKDI